MDPLKVSIIGVIISVVVVIAFSSAFDVSLGDIAAIGVTTLAFTSVFGVIRILIQGFRFRLLIGSYSPSLGKSLGETLHVRMASEFVAMSTPALVGGEIIRVAWLSRAGVKVGRALWIASAEGFHDISVVAVIGSIAAVYVALKGDIWPAMLIAAAALVPAGVFGGILFVIIRGTQFPSRWAKLVLGRFFNPSRTASFTENAEVAWADFVAAAKKYFHKSSAPLLLKLTFLSLLNVILAGVIVFLLFNQDGMGFEVSVLAAHAAFALGNLPVTPGGTGLNEVGLSLFSSTALGFTIFSRVVAWRIASYYVGLVLTGIMLAALASRNTIIRPRVPAMK